MGLEVAWLIASAAPENSILTNRQKGCQCDRPGVRLLRRDGCGRFASFPGGLHLSAEVFHNCGKTCGNPLVCRRRPVQTLVFRGVLGRRKMGTSSGTRP